MLLKRDFLLRFCKLNSGSKQKREEENQSSRTLWVGIVTRWDPLLHELRGFNEDKLTLLSNRGCLRALSSFERWTFWEKLKVDSRRLSKTAVVALKGIFPQDFISKSSTCNNFAIDTSSTVQEMGGKVGANAQRGSFYSIASGGWVRRGRSGVQQPLRRCTRLATLRKMIYCVCRGICVRSPARPGPPHRKGALFIVDCRSPLLSLLMIFVPFPKNVRPPSPFVGWRRMRENFHFCVITKTAIETSQGKCTRLKSSTEFSPAAAQKLIFPTESEEVFKNCVEAVRKKNQNKQ